MLSSPATAKETTVSTKYSITNDSVARHATNLDQAVQSMNQNLNQFISSLQSLPGVWKGSSFTSFDGVQQRWQQASRELNRALSEIRGRVGNSAQIYESGHQQQTADINQINASANWDASAFRG